MHIQPTDRGHVELERVRPKQGKQKMIWAWNMKACFDAAGHVTFCNMLHCCITFCWLCRRPNVTLPQMNCHVQWFTVIKKRKFVALPWHCLYLDGEEQKNVKRMATLDQKLAGGTPLPRPQSESILSLLQWSKSILTLRPLPPASEYSDCGNADKWNVGWGWS